MINRRSRNLVMWLIVAAILFLLVNVNYLQPRFQDCDCPECLVQATSEFSADPPSLRGFEENDRRNEGTEEMGAKEKEEPNKLPSEDRKFRNTGSSEKEENPPEPMPPLERMDELEEDKKPETPPPPPPPETPLPREKIVFEKTPTKRLPGKFGEFADDDDYPSYLSYGQYTKPKIYEPELRDRVDPRIKSNCKFCEYPLYERIFFHSGTRYGFVDSFIGSFGEVLYVLTDRPVSGSVFPSSPIHIEVYPIDPSFTLTKTNEDGTTQILKAPFIIPSSSTVKTNKVYIFKFSMEGFEELLETCFHIQMISGEEKREVLKKRIYVRHCYEPKEKKDGEKKDQLAICSMFEDRDRFLVEWIEWHLMMGVSHFYLYFHPGGFHYYDAAYSILEDYMKQGIVSMFIWNYTLPHHARNPKNYNADQIASQDDCVWRFRDKTKFMAFIDDDEFIVPVESDDFLQIMERRHQQSPRSDGFHLNSFVFGPGRSTDSHLSTSHYFKFQKKDWSYRKLVTVLDHVQAFTVHVVEVGNGGGTPKMAEEGRDGAFLAHYYYRKWHDYNEIWNKTEDALANPHFQTIQRFSNELEKRVSAYEEKANVEKYNFEYHVRIKPPK